MRIKYFSEKIIKIKVVLKLFIVCLMTVLISCAPVTTVSDNGSTIKHYFGYVRVIEPPTFGHYEQFKVLEVKTLGFRIEKGLGFGYFHERNEYIPLDCRLVIRVANEHQLKDVLSNLSFIEKEGLCVTVDSK